MVNAVNEEILKLRQELSHLDAENKMLRSAKDKFGLSFKRHPEQGEAQMLRNGGIPYLVKQPDFSVIKDEPQRGEHVLIESDNISALVALQATHKGKVDVIYIDPPYNTGNNDFVYNDRYVSNEDGFRHSKWLSFMERRLVLAKELLSDTGVICVSIDDNEQAALKMLMDSVFGGQNFVANIIWQGGRKNDSRFVSVGHDYIIIYSKDKDRLQGENVKWRSKKKGLNEIVDAGKYSYERAVKDALIELKNVAMSSNGRELGDLHDIYKRDINAVDQTFGDWLAKCINYPGLDKIRTDFIAPHATKYLKEWFKTKEAVQSFASKHYNNVDGLGRVFFPDNISWPGGGGPRYTVNHPSTGLAVPIPSSGWRYTLNRMQEEIGNGNIMFGADETRGINIKRYLLDTGDQVLESLITKDRRGANKLLQSIIGAGKFNFPKDYQVLAEWIDYVSNNNQNAIILDFFAGSGTTGHAVAALNAEDGGSRQAILVTNNFEQDGSPNGIARDVTAARMKAVLTGVWADGKAHETLPGNLHYYQVKFRKFTDPYGEALTWDNNAYSGIAALENNTHIVVDVDDFVGKSELISRIEDGQATVLRSDVMAVLVWAAYDELMLEEDEVAQAIQEFLNFSTENGYTPRFLVCSEFSDTDRIPSGYLFKAAQVSSFPLVYTDKVKATVSPLVAQGMLDKFVENAVEGLGTEAGPALDR